MLHYALLVSLIFVLLLIYFIAFLYKRFFSNRFSSIKGKVGIRQISSYYVGPKQKVVVFDFNGRQFACGVTPSSINLIAELFEDNGNEKSHSQDKDEKIIKTEIPSSILSIKPPFIVVEFLYLARLPSI